MEMIDLLNRIEKRKAEKESIFVNCPCLSNRVRKSKKLLRYSEFDTFSVGKHVESNQA